MTLKTTSVTVAIVLFGAAASFTSDPWNHQPQNIPGRVECEWYDLGGEGVAYHDKDAINNGSGKLNPVNGDALNEFRMKEGVDISYTKQRNIDNNPFNKVEPAMNQLYVGWTEPGEWIRYTVKVKQNGNYRIGLMYTANRDASIRFDLDSKPLTSDLKITSTFHTQDTIPWRQWHHWNKTDSLTSVKLKKGIHTLTLRVAEQGNMNFDYLEFVKL